MFRLEKVDGPECPECFCNDSELIEQQVRTGTKIDNLAGTRERLVATSELRRCNNCQQTWWIRGAWKLADEKAKPETRLVDERRDGRYCPKCGAGPSSTKATSTRRGVQYRKCSSCGENFKNLTR